MEDEQYAETHGPASRPPSRASDTDDGNVGEHVSLGKVTRLFHKHLTARKCSPSGDFLPQDAPPSSPSTREHDDWFPFEDQLQFETADLLYRRAQASATIIDGLCNLWALSHLGQNTTSPYPNHKILYDTIDRIKQGDVPWQTFNVTYQGPRPNTNVPAWMDQEFDVWFRDPREVAKNILSRPDLKDDLDFTPYRDYDASDVRQFENLFSGDWAWDQADQISEDPDTHGATFVPFILGSDKTTVSVATGHTEYYPLYLSIGNVHNAARRARRNAVAVIGFLSVPKTDQIYADDPKFRHFRRQLYHASLSAILQVFKPGMTKYEVVQFGDGFHRRVIWGVGPYIADYPEQVLLAGVVQGWCPRCLAFPDDLDADAPLRCEEHTEVLVDELHPGVLWDSYGIIANVVPFTNDFPRADIHELIAPDLLHQLIKGTFKDHLVTWVGNYLKAEHPKATYRRIMKDIDERIAAAAPFAGLRRFPQGRGFKQWTGDDSKALMKVYLPAIEKHVPDAMVRTIWAFLEFCYIVRRDRITETDLDDLQDALDRFHHYRAVFATSGAAASLSLPRQHSLKHYIWLVRQFGAPNGLCSSITESKHIEAVKEPWRRSSRFKALGQMLLTNQRLDKLKATRVEFDARGMLDPLYVVGNVQATRSFEVDDWQEDGEEDGGEDDIDGFALMAEVKLARKPGALYTGLSDELGIPRLSRLARRFLYTQLSTDRTRPTRTVPSRDLPFLPKTIKVFNSAVSMFRAPSDLCGLSGLKRERIRSTPLWRGEAPRRDCVYVVTDPEAKGIASMEVARVLAFFSFRYEDITYPCAVVHWFNYDGDSRNENTGMYMVRPSFYDNGAPHVEVIHVDTILRAAHLLPMFGPGFVIPGTTCYSSYDNYQGFYVNRFADHHAFEIV
ncbi:hypothetical protein CONPUDRAFT_68201 [Coniophora puteana RWD-64-598 SS2]|uniref:Uncharacterized protein n=1 Tax=Coniophora puteana (strain RWD-64-598) TaxID=741705 RepID=R7SCJ1_CONPW|nr:uncharacterized protein CONPUDRAFT_68201 [Coniophora puteana RWD-64-598 SS2]EIW73886.1 hypothetical protein CONPUDRAFT_68201 [Coniophora puteana RWD-64-598 SS2]